MAAYNYPLEEFPEAAKVKSRLTWSQVAWLGLCALITPLYFALSLIIYPFTRHKKLGLFASAKANVMRFLFNANSLETIQKMANFKPLRIIMSSLLRYEGLNHYNHIFKDAESSNSRWVYEAANRGLHDPVMLFFHGGAFQLKCNPETVTRVYTICEKLGISGLLLDYSVAPYFQYPTQLEEAIDAYRGLCKSCDNIIIAGCSAGGNLAMALALKIKELELGSNLWGIYVHSPWVEFYPRPFGSYANNKRIDWIPPSWLERSADEYTHDCRNCEDVLVQPYLATQEQWEGAIPNNSILIYGTQEILADQCRALATKAHITSVFAYDRGIHGSGVNFEHNGPHIDYLFRTLKQWLAVLEGTVV